MLGALTAGVVIVGLVVDSDPDGEIGSADADVTTTSSARDGSSVPAVSPSTTASVSTSTTTPTTSTSTTTTSTTTTSTTTTLVPDEGKASDERRLVHTFRVSDGDLQPKSIVASGDGLFFAQNMMYRHNVSVFDRSGMRVALIPDEVDLATLGVPGGVVARGAPVEAAFTP
ncbi:MAG TPA: hypothetical protein VGK49_09625, partial [Ilumatobacteraceae bacterium]